MIYKIEAEYTVTKKMIVSVSDGEDPKDPGNWIDIIEEHDSDCQLSDVITAEEE